MKRAPAPIEITEAATAYFRQRVRRDDDGCWRWTGGLNSKGYGNMNPAGSKTMAAHRYSHALHTGDPAGFVVRHTCHECRCVNPDHLALGTVAENNADTLRSGRWSTRPAHQKLSDDQVRDLKHARAQGVPAYHVARSFGIGVNAVLAIDEGKHFAHIEGQPAADGRTYRAAKYRPISRRSRPGKPRKLTRADVLELRRLRSEGATWVELEKRYGVAADYAAEIGKGSCGHERCLRRLKRQKQLMPSTS